MKIVLFLWIAIFSSRYSLSLLNVMSVRNTNAYLLVYEWQLLMNILVFQSRLMCSTIVMLGYEDSLGCFALKRNWPSNPIWSCPCYRSLNKFLRHLRCWRASATPRPSATTTRPGSGSTSRSSSTEVSSPAPTWPSTSWRSRGSSPMRRTRETTTSSTRCWPVSRSSWSCTRARLFTARWRVTFYIGTQRYYFLHLISFFIPHLCLVRHWNRVPGWQD